jgi:hypothetical protein
LPQQLAAASSNVTRFYNTYNPGFTLQPDFIESLPIKLYPKSTTKVDGHGLTLRYNVAPELQVKSITDYRKVASAYSNFSGAYPQQFGNVTAVTDTAGLPAAGAPPFAVRPTTFRS